MYRIALALVLALTAGAPTSIALADSTLKCTVRSVHDGDSMRVQCPGQRRTTPVRMEQIDAPEIDQAYGTRARDRLRALCKVGSTAVIRTQGRDQYGRMLGNVYCGEKSVNEEMVASGAAWPYDRYVKDRSLYALKDEARRQKRGLWAGSDPEPPWRWRYRQRTTD